MDWNTNTEQYLRQLSELQRGIFTSRASMMPNMPSSNMPNTRDTVDNTLKIPATGGHEFSGISGYDGSSVNRSPEAILGKLFQNAWQAVNYKAD